MTAREKKLSFAVGGVVTLMLNYLLIGFFFQKQSSLRDELARKTSELEVKQMLFEGKDLWEKRSAWIQSVQPKLTHESGAGVALLDQVKELATRQSVLLEAPAINTLQRLPENLSVSVNFETKSTWTTLCAFLRDLQGPERFIVFETATVAVDEADKTQMRGRFRVAKWFAPK